MNHYNLKNPTKTNDVICAPIREHILKTGHGNEFRFAKANVSYSGSYTLWTET